MSVKKVMAAISVAAMLVATSAHADVNYNTLSAKDAAKIASLSRARATMDTHRSSHATEAEYVLAALGIGVVVLGVYYATKSP